MEIDRELLEKLAKDPTLIQRAIRSDNLDSFKNEFDVVKSSGLRCPACSQYGQSGGSLWWNPNRYGSLEKKFPESEVILDHEFVCRKCERVWHIECTTHPIEDVIKEIKGK